MQSKCDPLRYLISKIVSQRKYQDINNIQYYKIIDHFGDYESLNNADINVLAQAIPSARNSTGRASAILSLLDWTMSTFQNYSLSPLNNWSDDKILDQMSKLRGLSLNLISHMLCFSLARDILPINVFVKRILSRIGIAGKNWPLSKLFFSIKPVIPFGKSYFLYENLKDFGGKICRNKPVCELCDFGMICDFRMMKNDWITA